MKRRLLLLTALLLPVTAAAQVVQGKVVDNTGAPLPGAFVALLNSEGRQLGALLAGARGEFVFRVAPGRYSLRAEQIGHQTTTVPHFDVAVNSVVLRDVKMEIAALRIREISVSAGNRCAARPEGSAATAAVWAEVRKALNVAAWMQGSGAVTFRVKNYERDTDLEIRDVRAPTLEFGSRAGRNAYIAANVDSLAERGFLQTRGDSAFIYGPDAHVLLSNTFLSLHCFRLERRPDRRGQIGLAFEPVAGRRVPDIAGTMWLDENTARLRHVEFVYRNVPNYDDARYAGGRTEFEQLSNGAWIVRRWSLRSPRLGRAASSVEVKTIGMRETGGEVLDVQIAGVGTTTIVPRYTIAGMTYDSVHNLPLPGARVYLSGTPFSTAANESGRFRMDSIPAGEYLIAFSHPRLDSLPGYPEPQRLRAFANSSDVLLATPSAQRITDTVCAPDSWTRAAALSRDTTTANRGVVFGVVSSANAPLEGANVDALWRRVYYAGPGETIKPEHMKSLGMRGFGFGVLSDAQGFYSLCRLPLDRPVVVEIKVRDVLLLRDTVRVPDSRVLRRDYDVRR